MSSLIEIRQQAFEYYLNGRYAKAENLLRPLIAAGFDLPSTHCHLGRVLLMMDRESEARQEVAQAWEHRGEEAAYVIPRILFFQLLFALWDESRAGAAGASSAPTGALAAPHPRPASADLLERLRDALMENNAYAQWTLGPLLRHLRPRLNAEDFELIRALAVEINGPGHDVPF